MNPLSKRFKASPPRFDFVDLRLLYLVAQTSSLTLAAERTCLSLPAASMRIKQIEANFGVTLLHRRVRGTTLTAAGEVFISHAETLLRAAEEMSESMAQLASGQRGRVVVWANTTAFRDFFPADLPAFLVDHPAVDIELSEHTSMEIVRALRDARIDVGIVSDAVDTTGLATVPYRVDEIVVCVPGGHELAQRESAAFADCLVHDFVGLEATNPLQAFAISAAVSRGLSMRLRVAVASFDALKRLVQAGVGIAVFPLSVAELIGGELHIVRLTDPWAVQNLKVCWIGKPEISAAARALVDHLRQASSAADRARPGFAGFACRRLPAPGL